MMVKIKKSSTLLMMQVQIALISTQDCYLVPINVSRSQAGWHTSIVPATLVAEVGGSLEPRTWQSAWAILQDSISKTKQSKTKPTKFERYIPMC